MNKLMNKSVRNNTIGLLFALPAMVLFSIFVFSPLIKICQGSLMDWNGVTAGTFIGIENFIELFNDDLFYKSLFNGLLSGALLTIIELTFGTILALTLLNKKIIGRNILRKTYFLPVVLSVTVVCQLWISMYDPTNGLFNKLFKILGLSYQQQWMSSMSLSSIITIVAVVAWQGIGYQFLLIYSAAKSIPQHFFEAATMDGASPLRTHLKITIPLLSETYKVCVLFTFLQGVNMFAQTQIMTSGGPGTATYTLPYMMYRESFMSSRYGYGSAIAMVIMILCLVVMLLINKFIAREKITY